MERETEDDTLELWLRVDETLRTRMLEVTWGAPGTGTRISAWESGTVLLVRARGIETGMQRQHVHLPPGTGLAPPSIAASAWGLLRTLREGGEDPAGCRVARSADAPLASLASRHVRLADEAARVATPAGLFPARELIVNDAQGKTNWWLHATLPLPLRVRAADGHAAELIEFEEGR